MRNNMRNTLKFAFIAALAVSSVSAMEMDRSSPEYYRSQAKVQLQNGNREMATRYLGLEKQAKLVQQRKQNATQLKVQLNTVQMAETPKQEVGFLTRLYNYVMGWLGY